jgi:hypothetical protein
MSDQSVRAETVVTPVLLTPTIVAKMLAKRQAVQVAKFRTTCTVCRHQHAFAPNLCSA